MAYLSDSECDVFVSYATANNQAIAKSAPGGVTSLRDVFETMLFLIHYDPVSPDRWPTGLGGLSARLLPFVPFS